MWPQEEKQGGFENAARTPLPLVDECDPEEKAAAESGGSVVGVGGDWGFQKAPVDWLLMAENSMDPNHAPFLVRKGLFRRRKSLRKTGGNAFFSFFLFFFLREREGEKEAKKANGKTNTRTKKISAARDDDGAQHPAVRGPDGDADLAREAREPPGLRAGAR